MKPVEKKSIWSLDAIPCVAAIHSHDGQGPGPVIGKNSFGCWVHSSTVVRFDSLATTVSRGAAEAQQKARRNYWAENTCGL